jgi:serine protease Do
VRSLPRLVSRVPVGKTIDVEVMRKGARQVLKVVVGRLEEAEKDKDGGPDDPAGTGPAVLGMTLAPLDDALRKKFNITSRVAKGVVVTEVGADSPAGRKGLKAGDVIVEAAQDQVATIADVNKAIERVRKDGRRAILLRVEDGKGQMRYVAVPVAE